MIDQIHCFQRQSEGRLAPPDFSRAGEGLAGLATFFLAVGLVELAAGDAWNLLSQAQAEFLCQVDSPAEGTGVRTLVHFKKKVAARARG